MQNINESEFLMYKGRPLVRSGNTLYYGYMDDPSVVMMTVGRQETEKGLSMARAVSLVLMSTDQKLAAKDRFLKRGERDSLYGAIELADIWLSREERG